MIDSDIHRLCAEAMGYKIISDDPNWISDSPARTEVALPDGTILIERRNAPPRTYMPLHDDAQAMALVKKFKLMITPDIAPIEWRVELNNFTGRNENLNRAICECVAKMRAGK